jgi:hypothetical protein
MSSDFGNLLLYLENRNLMKKYIEFQHNICYKLKWQRAMTLPSHHPSLEIQLVIQISPD